VSGTGTPQPADPAEEAARSAFQDQWPDQGDLEFRHSIEGRFGVAAAREALAPLKDIHRPFTRNYTGGDGRTVCHHCLGPVDWPCLTARMVYPEEEL
jgi:hypothetical protein